MDRKIGLADFGRLVKPQTLTEAFLHFSLENVEPYEWWVQVSGLHCSSKTYKKDMITSTYGKPLAALFSDLELDSYVGVICSFLVLQSGDCHFVYNARMADRILAKKHRWSIRAVGIRFHKSYDVATKNPGQLWEPTNNASVAWYYKPKHLIPLEDVEQFNKVEPGDMIVFKTTQALVIRVQTVQRHRFWKCCSWSSKKITVLSGGAGHQVRLSTNRPYEVIKRPNRALPRLPLDLPAHS